MNDTESAAGARQPVKLPFNNLYLISGLVHGFNKGYMYLLTLLFFITAYFSYQFIALPVLAQRLQANGYGLYDIMENSTLLFNAQALGLDRNVVLLIELGMFVAAFFGFYFGLRKIHRKTLTSVLTGFERFRVPRFLFSFGIWALMITALTLLAFFSGAEDIKVVFDGPNFLLSALILLLFLPVQVAIEELIFRGYLIQGLSLLFRNGVIPLLISSLLFGLAHMSNPEVERHGWQLMLPYYCANALFMGLITLLDEGLELAYGMHLANNLVSGMLITTPNSVLQPYTVFLAGSEDPAMEMLVWLVMAAVAFGAYWMRFRWKDFSLVIK